MKVITFSVGQLKANCHLLIDEKTHHCLIIDPGDDVDFIISHLERGLRPAAILATHGHFDHVMAACELQLAYDLPFYIHQKDQFLLDRLEETARHFLGNIEVPPAPKKITYYKQTKTIQIGSFQLTIIPTPGHTPGSVSLYDKKNHLLFCGDVLFEGGGFGRTDFAYSSERDLQKSIAGIFKLPEDTTLYCGHGEKSTVGNEKKHHD